VNPSVLPPAGIKSRFPGCVSIHCSVDCLHSQLITYTVNLSALPISLSIYLTELYGYWEFNNFLPRIFLMRPEVYSCVVLLPYKIDQQSGVVLLLTIVTDSNSNRVWCKTAIFSTCRETHKQYITGYTKPYGIHNKYHS
jgi:hypothetical protein